MADEHVSRRKQGTTGLLCCFLGGLSAHRFYAGKIGTAVVQALLFIGGVISVVTFIVSDMTGRMIAPIFGITNLLLLGSVTSIFVDFIRIVAGRFRDVEGKLIVRRGASSGPPQDWLTSAEHQISSQRLQLEYPDER